MDETKEPKVRFAMERDRVALKAGIIGEDRILFELKNSHIPMFVLHNIYLEHEGLSAQIDFLIITGRRHFFFQCIGLVRRITSKNTGCSRNRSRKTFPKMQIASPLYQVFWKTLLPA